jgi:hypothetical protein
MQLEQGIMGNLPVCIGGHHSGSFYDGNKGTGSLYRRTRQKAIGRCRVPQGQFSLTDDFQAATHAKKD